MTFFSVIIPNYNHAAYLKQRIESVLAQTHSAYEMIILDDASTDNSKEIIESFRGHEKISHIIYSDTNSGSPFPQWEKGIALARGEWIWIAESDDTALPSFLAEAAAMLEQSPGAGLYYSDSLITDQSGAATGKASDTRNAFFETNKWSSAYTADGKAELNQYLKYLCTINNASAAVFKKELFTTVQQSIKSYRYFGDWYFYINAALQSGICYNNKALSSYRNHPGNFAASKGSIAETRKEYYRLLQFLLEREEITGKKKLIRFFSLHYLGTGWKKEGKIFSTFRQYVKMNTRLACSVIPKIIWYKIIGKKNNKQYP